MKTDIHPTYYKKAKATCVCGASFFVGSTAEKLEMEVCSECHPFYTGGEKVIDTAGRVEKFKTRTTVAKAMSDNRAASKKKRKGTKKEKK